MAPSSGPCCRYLGVGRVWTDYPDALVAELNDPHFGALLCRRNDGHGPGLFPGRCGATPRQRDVDEVRRLERDLRDLDLPARIARGQGELHAVELDHRP